jgi:hypothetical protein
LPGDDKKITFEHLNSFSCYLFDLFCKHSNESFKVYLVNPKATPDNEKNTGWRVKFGRLEMFHVFSDNFIWFAELVKSKTRVLQNDVFGT